MAEYMKAPAEDFYECPCGNSPRADGLYPCDAAGTEVEPDANWPGLYLCAGCGRIADPETYDAVACTVLVVRGSTAQHTTK